MNSLYEELTHVGGISTTNLGRSNPLFNEFTLWATNKDGVGGCKIKCARS